MFILHDSSPVCVLKQILLTGLLDSGSPSVVSELTELTRKQLQASPPPDAPPPSALRGGVKRRVGGDEMTGTVSEIEFVFMEALRVGLLTIILYH